MKKLLAMMAVVCVGQTGLAAQHFVRETIGQGVNEDDISVVTELVRNSVSGQPGESVVQNEFEADFVLQPRLMKLGDAYILTIEKIQDGETVYASQLKATSLAQLDRAAQRATTAAVNETQGTRVIASERRMPASTAAPTEAGAGEIRSETAIQQMQSTGRWFVGLGPFISRNLDSDALMYHVTGGYQWDVHSAAQIKILGEANMAAGGDSSQFYNVGIGANWHFMNLMTQAQLPTSPYITADIGLGSARDDRGRNAGGFSFGTGIGYQFFRESDRSLDVLIRYAVIADELANEDGLPSVIGANVAFAF